MDKDTSFELIVIGGGPAGTAGAISAGLFGHRVALIEKAATIGGAGLNSGTVPSKTLRETALALSGWQSRRLFGVDLSLRRETTVADFTRHRDAVSEAERMRIGANLDRLGVTRFHGTASFVDPHTISVNGADGSRAVLHGDRILIATGSSPWQPPEFPFDDPRVHDSDELLALATLPKRLVVIGAGVIGSEYASTFAVLGANVHRRGRPRQPVAVPRRGSVAGTGGGHGRGRRAFSLEGTRGLVRRVASRRSVADVEQRQHARDRRRAGVCWPVEQHRRTEPAGGRDCRRQTRSV